MSQRVSASWARSDESRTWRHWALLSRLTRSRGHLSGTGPRITFCTQCLSLCLQQTRPRDTANHFIFPSLSDCSEHRLEQRQFYIWILCRIRGLSHRFRGSVMWAVGILCRMGGGEPQVHWFCDMGRVRILWCVSGAEPQVQRCRVNRELLASGLGSSPHECDRDHQLWRRVLSELNALF